jgi:hypothetical protein
MRFEVGELLVKCGKQIIEISGRAAHFRGATGVAA